MNPTYHLKTEKTGYRVTRIDNGNENNTIKTGDGGEYTAPLGCIISFEHFEQLMELEASAMFHIEGKDDEGEAALAELKANGYDIYDGYDARRQGAIMKTHQMGHEWRHIYLAVAFIADPDNKDTPLSISQRGTADMVLIDLLEEQENMNPAKGAN